MYTSSFKIEGHSALKARKISAQGEERQLGALGKDYPPEGSPERAKKARCVNNLTLELRIYLTLNPSPEGEGLSSIARTMVSQRCGVD